MSQQPNTLDVLTRLAEVIESRKGGDPDKSYVARLFHKGTDTVLKKVGEEAVEAVMAGKDHAQQATAAAPAAAPAARPAAAPSINVAGGYVPRSISFNNRSEGSPE